MNIQLINNLSVRNKLLLGFTIILAIMAIVSATAAISMGSSTSKAKSAVADQLPILSLANDITGKVNEADVLATLSII